MATAEGMETDVSKVEMTTAQLDMVVEAKAEAESNPMNEFKKKQNKKKTN